MFNALSNALSPTNRASTPPPQPLPEPRTPHTPRKPTAALATPPITPGPLSVRPPAEKAVTQPRTPISVTNPPSTPITPPKTPSINPPSIKGPHSSAQRRLQQKLDQTREVVAARDYYLAHSNVFGPSITWYRDGRSNNVVSKAAATAALEAYAAHAADPTNIDPPSESPTPISFTIIATISQDRCFVQCDGNWKGDGYPAEFSDITLAFALISPPADHPTLVADFKLAKAFVDEMVKKIETKGAKLKQGAAFAAMIQSHIRLRHRPFEPKAIISEDQDDEVLTLNDDRSGPFSIEGWKTWTNEAAKALPALQATHVARPLPAYNAHGELIQPARYKAELCGATVVASFTMQHYTISEKPKGEKGPETIKDTYCFDTDYLRVLIPPTPQQSSLKRRQVSLSDPFGAASAGSSKKARVA